MTEGDGRPRKWREIAAPELNQAQIDHRDKPELMQKATESPAGGFLIKAIAGPIETADRRGDGLA